MFDTLHKLPLEILMQICANLSNKDIGGVSLVNKALLAVARSDSVWKSKFEIHFPDVFLKLNNRHPPIATDGWYAAFVHTYKDQYQTITDKRIRALFSRIKEGEDFTDLNVTFNDIYKHDINNKCIVDWAREKNNQTALDALHKNKSIRLSFAYRTIRGWVFPNESKHHVDILINTLLDWEILLRQPNHDIEKLVNCGAVYNNTALYVFALDGNLTALQFFLEHVQKTKGINLINSPELLLLSGAVANGHIKVVQYLLEQGADPEITGKRWHNRTPLCLAATYGHIEIVKLLLGKNVHTGDAIHEAAKNGPCLAEHDLIEIMKPLFGKNAHTKSPIHGAAKNGHLEIVKLLLESDKSLIASFNNSVQTPLHCAAANGHAKIAQYLLEQRADPDIGTNPVGLAAKNGYLDVVQLLLKHDPTLINKTNLFNETPLILAATQGHLDIVAYLLEEGADLNAKTWDEETPFLCAGVNGHLNVVQLLVQKDPTLLKQSDTQKILAIAAANGHVAMVKYLLDQGIQPATVSFHNPGRYASPLSMAVENGHAETVKVLLDHGKTRKNITSLLPLAVANKNDAVVTLLLEHHLVEVTSPEMLVETLKDLPETCYQSALSHYQRFHKSLITQSDSLSCFFDQLSENQFKVFFTHTVQLGLYSIDQVITTAEVNSPTKKENFQNNQSFITNRVAPFTPHRKKIEALIAELHTKSSELIKNPSRSKAITSLANILQKKANRFFTNPSNENAKIFFDSCEVSVGSARTPIDVPRTSMVWRIVNTILLIAAHIFVVTIPFIWLHPASRNLLLGKTDSQAKADAALESVRELNQLVVEGKFNVFFAPVPVKANASPVIQPFQATISSN
jgi:ankyrin repeat protein